MPISGYLDLSRFLKLLFLDYEISDKTPKPKCLDTLQKPNLDLLVRNNSFLPHETNRFNKRFVPTLPILYPWDSDEP